jgi:hypothetical protein
VVKITRPLCFVVGMFSLVGCGAKSNGEHAGNGESRGTATATVTAAGTATVTATALATATTTASASASAVVEDAAPPPDVEVKNIGMHIGGGPNDTATKAPIKRSVDPHMSEFARCFAKADDREKAGDVSVDLRIEAAGGKAELKKYKSALSGAAFRGCVEAVFRDIEFEKPKTGATVVSYSLRFTPKKK